MSPEAAPEELLGLAVEAARTAGSLLLERSSRGAESTISSKTTPTDLVSEADLTAERVIRELLTERRPDDGILGEEGGQREESRSGLTWVVDPLDGTVNFLFGIPQWCVSVAVRDGQGTLAGAVYDPNRDELFTATRGDPAMLTRAGAEPVRLRARTAEPLAAEDSDDLLAGAMVATGMAYDAEVRARQGEVLARLLPIVRDIRRLGSAALDLTWTAAGRYDAYFERTVKAWDIAAGQLICEQSGLVVVELEERPGLPWGILVTRPELAGRLAELVS